MYTTYLPLSPAEASTTGTDWLVHLDSPMNKAKKAFLAPLSLRKGITEITGLDTNRFNDSIVGFKARSPDFTCANTINATDSDRNKSELTVKYLPSDKKKFAKT
jgi:hypothetical protein